MLTKSRIVALAALGAAFLLAQGCAHHCGYTDVRMTTSIIPTGQKNQPEPRRMIIVLDQPTPESPAMRLALIRELLIERPALMEFSGIELRVPFQWSWRVLEKLPPVSLIFAAYKPLTTPHTHDAAVWGAGDYLRDFVAWLNPFEALPDGTQERYDDRVMFRKENGWAPVQRQVLRVPRSEIQVLIKGRIVGSLTTDPEGIASLDLRRLAQEIPGPEGVVITLKSDDAVRRVVVDRALVASLYRLTR